MFFFSLDSFKIFLYVWFSVVWKLYARVWFCRACILLGVFWTSWICVLVSDLIWGEIVSHYCFKYCLILFSFFSFSYSHYVYVRPFIVVPQSLNIQFYFFHLFSLCFSILKVSIACPQAQSILFSAISVLRRGPLKIFIIPVILFLISSIYFWFLEFSSLFVLSICPCMLSPFSILSLIISTYLPYLILVLMLAQSLQSIIFPL